MSGLLTLLHIGQRYMLSRVIDEEYRHRYIARECPGKLKDPSQFLLFRDLAQYGDTQQQDHRDGD